MKNIKEYLLLALALVLGTIAIFKLTKGEPLFVPVSEVNMTTTYTVTATPLVATGDVKEKDPLGLLGTTLYFTPPPNSHPTRAKVFGKIYPLYNNSVKIDQKVDKPLEISLLEFRNYCAIPKTAIVTIGKKEYVLTKEGVKEVVVAHTFGDEIYILPPCPKAVAIGNDLKKRVKKLLHPR